jgi:hypothetical protein
MSQHTLPGHRRLRELAPVIGNDPSEEHPRGHRLEPANRTRSFPGHDRAPVGGGPRPAATSSPHSRLRNGGPVILDWPISGRRGGRRATVPRPSCVGWSRHS